MARQGSTVLNFISRLWGGGKKEADVSPELRDTIPAPSSDANDPAEISDVRAVRVLTREQTKRMLNENFIKEKMKVEMWPQVFLDYTVDMLMSAQNDHPRFGYFRNDPLVDFYRVFRQKKEEAEKTGDFVKIFYLISLAGWLEGAQFTRTKPGKQPETDWFVLDCTPEILDGTAPVVTAIRRGKDGLERDERVSLFDVFSGFNLDLKKG